MTTPVLTAVCSLVAGPGGWEAVSGRAVRWEFYANSELRGENTKLLSLTFYPPCLVVGQ